MTSQDQTAPATKQDIHMLMEMIGKYYDETKHRITESEERMKHHIAESEERTKRHFDVVAEQIRHDALGANRDEIEVIKDRITRIEQHVGMAA